MSSSNPSLGRSAQRACLILQQGSLGLVFILGAGLFNLCLRLVELWKRETWTDEARITSVSSSNPGLGQSLQRARLILQQGSLGLVFILGAGLFNLRLRLIELRLAEFNDRAQA